MDNKQTRLSRTIKKLLVCGSMASLTLGPGLAFGLGIGQIQVRSALNQQLTAELPLLPDGPRELDSLTADISYQTYAGSGVGDSGNRFSYSIVQRGGRPVLRIVSERPVREPLVNLLVELRWDTGRLVREFAVLLDPAGTSGIAPVEDLQLPRTAERPRQGSSSTQAPTASQSAPRSSSAAAPAAAPSSPAPPARESADAGLGPERTGEPELPVPTLQSSAAPSPASEPSSQGSSQGGSGRYGPVAAGESLWGIAERTRPAGVSTAQMMRNIQRANPGAFVRGNPNALMRGVTLDIPGASGTVAAAAAPATASPELGSATRDITPTAVSDTPEPAAPAVTATTGSTTELTADTATTPAIPAAVEAGPVVPDNARIAMTDEGVGLRPAGMDAFRERMVEAGISSGTPSAPDTGDTTTPETAVPSPVTEPEETAEPAAATPEPMASDTTSVPEPVGDSTEPAPAVAEPQTAPDEPSVAEPTPEPMTADTQPTTTGPTVATELEPTQPSEPQAVSSEPAAVDATPESVSTLSEPQLPTPDEPSIAEPESPSTEPRTLPTESPVTAVGDDPAPIDEPGTTTDTPETDTSAQTETEVTPPGPSVVTAPTRTSEPQLSAIQKALIWVRNPTNLQILGGGALGLLVLGWIVAKLLGRRKKAHEAIDEEDFSEVDAFTESDHSTVHGDDDAPLAATDGDDPLERADMMLELGDHEQAEVTLLSALEEHPDDLDLRCKLLEVYHQTKDTDQFVEQAGVLAQQVGNDRNHPRWLWATELGRQLAPTNPLFAAADDSAATRRITPEDAFDPPAFDDEEEDATAIFGNDDATESTAVGGAAAAGDDMDFDFTDLGEPSDGAAASQEDDFDQAFDFSFDDDDDSPTTTASAAPADDTEADETLMDFDMGSDDAAATEATAPVSSEETTEDDDFAGLDFGFGDDDDDDVTSMFSADATDDVVATDTQGGDDDFGNLDLDMIGATDSTSTPDEPEDETLMDFETESLFDSEPVNLEAQEEDPLGDELAGLDFDMPGGEEPTVMDTGGDEDIFSVDDDGGSTELDLLNDNDAAEGDGEFFAAEDYVETKLDLANAYIDMEDPVGARSLLEEVLKEGNNEQQQRAEALMQRLS